MADFLTETITLLFARGPAALLAVAATQILAEALLWAVVHILKPLTARTKTSLDDFLVEALPTPIRVGALLVGLTLAGWALFPAFPADKMPMNQGWEYWVITSLIAGFGLLAGGVANALVKWYYYELSPALKGRHGGEALHITRDMFPMARKAVVGVVYALAGMVVLTRFGVEISPLLAGLGVAGLAVGLALQDTLGNFFAGINLLADSPVRIGDFISLENEKGILKGFVEEIGWRTTRIRTRGNYTYYIPNSKLAGSVIVNFSRGIEDNWKGSSLGFGVAYDSDPEVVKRVVLEAVKGLQKRDPRFGVQEPLVRLEEFGDSALQYKVFWTIRNFHETEMVAGDVREAVLKVLRANKIDIPFPQRVMHVQYPPGEGARGALGGGEGAPSPKRTGRKR